MVPLIGIIFMFHHHCFNYINNSRTNSPPWARICQSTASLRFTCPKTEVNNHDDDGDNDNKSSTTLLLINSEFHAVSLNII